MIGWLKRMAGARLANPLVIPELLWQHVFASYPFLQALGRDDELRLRGLVSQFLAQKEFTGAHGLEVTDGMALAIAAQACLPVLHLGLTLYDGFKGIVVHPGAMLARREVMDGAGVVHRYSEALSGEAMEGGPVTLSWKDVAAGGESAARGYNVVIHEFVHKLDMRDGAPNGCPPLPTREARTVWQAVMQNAYADFREKAIIAERFAGEAPWLDRYGATSPAEFFAVTSEAYFINRARFEIEFPSLAALFDSFFKAKSA
jgi:Mlc titration factor MtfA (ptsG expression regulator)